MKSKARLTKVTRDFLCLCFALLQRLQLKKYLWKTTRIPSVSGLVNTAYLRYSRHRCGKIRSRVSQPAKLSWEHILNNYVLRFRSSAKR